MVFILFISEVSSHIYPHTLEKHRETEKIARNRVLMEGRMLIGKPLSPAKPLEVRGMMCGASEA